MQKKMSFVASSDAQSRRMQKSISNNNSISSLKQMKIANEKKE